MGNMLKQLCNKKGYALVYTKNKKVVLSFGSNNGKPAVRASRVFENCPDEVAVAVVSFINDVEGCKKWLAVIESYLKDEQGLVEFVIKEPKNRAVKGRKASGSLEALTNIDNEKYEEYNVIKITQTDFKGNIRKVVGGTAIRVNHGLLDVDIVVDDH